LRFTGAFAALFVLTATMAQAERPALSPEEQKAEATHIVTGVVKAVYSREVETALYGKGTLETHYLLEIEVRGVEKGGGIEKGDIVYARCWRLKKHGESGLAPGPSGHSDIPKEGEQVRAFLSKGKYDPTGQADNGSTLVYPNGIEKLKAK
jgi:hypothetical protein